MKTNNYLIAFLLIFSSLCLADPAQELIGYLSPYKEVTVNFKQVAHEKNTNGRISFKKPNLFLWELFDPHYQFMEIKGLKVKMYDKELKQLIYHKIDQQFIPAQILIDSKNIPLHFKIEKQVKNHQAIFTLTPHTLREITVIRLIFEKQQLKELVFSDQFQEETRLIFGEFKKYTPLNWQLPKDTEIIDMEEE